MALAEEDAGRVVAPSSVEDFRYTGSVRVELSQRLCLQGNGQLHRRVDTIYHISMEGIPIETIDLNLRAAGRRRYIRRVQYRRLRTYFHPFFRTTDPTTGRFVLLSQVRAGSHLVQSLLNAHPDIFCDDEIFMLRRAFSPSWLLKNAMGARREPVCGFMLKPHTPQEEQRSTTEHWIPWLRNDGFKVVHLHREDVLRQALSYYTANEREIWIHKKGVVHRVEPRALDVARLLKIRWFIESWKEIESRWVGGLPSISFSYERDLQSADRHQRTAEAIFDFLGVESAPVRAPIERMLPAHPSEYVTNWEEVVRAWEEDGQRTAEQAR